MTSEEIARMQARMNASGLLPVALVVDGFWGPRSIAACELYCRRLMPAVNPWPAPTQMHLQQFYGSPGDESQLVRMQFPYRMLYDGRAVTSTMVHRKCAESLRRILERVGTKFLATPHIVDEATDYGGVYNNRAMRGGTLPSLHARGAAIDLDADDNGNRVAWPTGADMPLEIIEEFSKEGWTSAAVFWGRDAMHFQATRPD
jgi:hypothetical protein